jgi:hypothetical protein
LGSIEVIELVRAGKGGGEFSLRSCG